VGTGLSGGLDFNSNGLGDLLVGAPAEDVAGIDTGAFYILHGADM